VLDGRLVRGPQGLAATLGPFPVAPSRLASAKHDNRDFDYLYRRASLFVLRDHLRHHGVILDGEDALEAPEAAWAALIDEWCADAALALAQAIQGAAAIIDVEAIIIASALPDSVLQNLTDRVESLLARDARRMIVAPRILVGRAGLHPSVRGAAMVPFSELLGIGNSHHPS